MGMLNGKYYSGIAMEVYVVIHLLLNPLYVSDTVVDG